MAIDSAPGFEAFWAAYPLKVGKLSALKVWTKLHPDAALVQAILKSVDEHTYCRRWRDGFICNPDTFLRQGRWLDELRARDF